MNKYGRGPVPGKEKNGYVPLRTYQNNNFKNFGGGPVQYFKKIPYSNFLGRTSKKKHPVVTVVIVPVAIETVVIVTLLIGRVVMVTVIIETVVIVSVVIVTVVIATVVIVTVVIGTVVIVT